MKNFHEYLMEVEKEEQQGTFASLKLDEKSVQKLSEWVAEHKIVNAIEESKYHCTVVYSRKKVPELEDFSVKLPIRAHFYEWKILDGNVLVLVLKSTRIHSLFDQTKKLGAESDYSEYIPHVSIATNWAKKDLPSEIPDFSIVFNEFKVETLDEDFSY
ncbi:Uncharacterised protein [uncultured archaeon]|nr:Uncharacterised protein [uncultured archaeon]